MKMGWINDQLRRIAKLETGENESAPPAQDDFAGVQSVWERLQSGIQRDAEEFRRAGRACEFERSSDLQVRVLNSAAKVVAVIIADLDGKTIEYSYRAESGDVAVPEQGILTIRQHGASEQLYSSDQPVSLEEARRMILEPVLFPDLPSDQAVA